MVFIDVSVGDQEYIEDCQVCCRPIEFDVRVEMDRTVDVRVRTDSD